RSCECTGGGPHVCHVHAPEPWPGLAVYERSGGSSQNSYCGAVQPVDEGVNTTVEPAACGDGRFGATLADVQPATPSVKLVIAYDSYVLGAKAAPSHTPTSYVPEA